MLADLPFSFCLFCTSLIRKDVGCCRTCKSRLREFIQAGSISQTRFLFPWIRDRSPQVSKLVQGLKYGLNRKLWNWLSKEFIRAHGAAVMNLIQGTVLIPVPPSKHDQQDHAFFWAQALSNDLSIPLAIGGNFQKGPPQKRLSKNQRLSRTITGEFEVSEHVTNAIIIDDILTTGATARAVIRQVDSERSVRGQPPLNWEVWVLAYRRLE